MSKKQRIVWLDAAKGFAILLVVLSHLTSKHVAELGWGLPNFVELAWLGLSGFLTPIRMPLFFAISGFFVHKYLESPWGGIARPRVFSGYYLYLLWFSIHSLFFHLAPPFQTATPTTWGEYLVGLAWGYSSLWYLYALPVYFIIAKLLRRWCVQTVLLAAILSILSSTELAPDLGNSASLMRNLVFFLAVAYFPTLLTRPSENARNNLWSSIAIFTLISASVAALTYLMDAKNIDSTLFDFILGTASLISGIVGIIVGAKIFPRLEQTAANIAAQLAFIGRNTLPVYVLHLPVLVGLSALLSGTQPPFIIALVYPVIALVGVVAVSLAIHRFLLYIRAGWLFRMPGSIFSLLFGTLATSRRITRSGNLSERNNLEIGTSGVKTQDLGQSKN